MAQSRRSELQDELKKTPYYMVLYGILYLIDLWSQSRGIGRLFYKLILSEALLDFYPQVFTSLSHYKYQTRSIIISCGGQDNYILQASIEVDDIIHITKYVFPNFWISIPEEGDIVSTAIFKFRRARTFTAAAKLADTIRFNNIYPIGVIIVRSDMTCLL